MKQIFWLLIALLMAGCSFSLEENPTLTPTPLPTIGVATLTYTPTTTPTDTATPSPTATNTHVPTDTLIPTSEPSSTPTHSPTPTDTPLPTSTPMPQVEFKNDQWQQIDVAPQLEEGISTNWLAFVNYNDRTSRTSSPEPASQIQSLYMYRPDTNQRLKVFDMPASVGNRIFPSPAGTHFAYFVEPGTGIAEDGNTQGGLYMLDLRIGLSYRLFDIPNINPRGILGHAPSWSGDGKKMAVALTTDYATDIFIMNADGTNFRNITEHGSYDMWPALSSDGLWLAFVSDRLTCASWTPNDPGTCNVPNASHPTEGNLFILNLNTGELRQVTDIKLNGAPRWITDTKLVFSTGGGNALATQSDIWIVDIEAGSAVQITEPGTLNISEAWTRDASQVLYQRAANTTLIILESNVGQELATTSAFIFPRYGLAADWSPDGQFIALGGRNGQCPYGIIVVDSLLQVVTEPGRNLLACDPMYAPEGRYMAYVGIRPGTTTDGRVDIYLANTNGLGARSVTADLVGQMLLLDWVGPTPQEEE